MSTRQSRAKARERQGSEGGAAKEGRSGDGGRGGRGGRGEMGSTTTGGQVRKTVDSALHKLSRKPRQPVVERSSMISAEITKRNFSLTNRGALLGTLGNCVCQTSDSRTSDSRARDEVLRPSRLASMLTEA